MAHTLQAPTGLRDFYPADLLRRRYIEKLWRDTAIRHGFEEIDGPTFEHAELYKIKSGEGILNEMFGVFSGKDESQRAALASGEAPYALRPEFTPTLARLYAAKAATLPKPCKWFWQQNCYRAEKPQRGRLREFMQWNCDVIGDSNLDADIDLLTTNVALLDSAGLSPSSVRVNIADRRVLSTALAHIGFDESQLPHWFVWIDRYDKLSPSQRLAAAASFGGTARQVLDIEALWAGIEPGAGQAAHEELAARGRAGLSEAARVEALAANEKARPAREYLNTIADACRTTGIVDWFRLNLKIVRGLAYYTGMVFEVIAEGERAIAGGGRYDNLIQLFGGPPTPAVGFGMGDVVLSLLLADKGLMPEGKDLLDALSAPAASFRPDAFAISNGTPEADAQVRPVVARLRRGTESAAWLAKEGRKPWDAARYCADSIGHKAGAAVDESDPAARPVHARHTYKTTKNVGKLLKEASDQHARAAVIIESGAHATVRNLETREEMKDVVVERIPRVIAGMMGG